MINRCNQTLLIGAPAPLFLYYLWIRRLRGSEDFVCERKNFIVYALLNFKPV